MSRAKTNNQAAGISSLIEQILASKGLDKKLQQYRAWTVWDEVVGPQIAQHAQPLRIRESVLEVRVENPTWMQQLQLLKPKILKELNQRLGESTLNDMRGAFDLLAPVVGKLQVIGGSHAQRDLFEQCWLDAGMKCGETSAVRPRLEARVKARPNDLFAKSRL